MIQSIHYKEILKNKSLLEEYAKDCLVKGYNPQEQIYENMYTAGVLHCLGDYREGVLAGFVSIIVSVMPLQMEHL